MIAAPSAGATASDASAARRAARPTIQPGTSSRPATTSVAAVRIQPESPDSPAATLAVIPPADLRAPAGSLASADGQARHTGPLGGVGGAASVQQEAQPGQVGGGELAGALAQVFAQADHVFEWRYSSAPIEHAPTETTGCIVVPQSSGRLLIHSNTQAAFFTLDNTALAAVPLTTPADIGRTALWVRLAATIV